MAISKEQMKDMYVKMRRIRDFESTAAKLFAEGKYPALSTCISARRPLPRPSASACATMTSSPARTAGTATSSPRAAT